jgi:hypothetical protein
VTGGAHTKGEIDIVEYTVLVAVDLKVVSMAVEETVLEKELLEGFKSRIFMSSLVTSQRQELVQTKPHARMFRALADPIGPLPSLPRSPETNQIFPQSLPRTISSLCPPSAAF